MSIDQRLFAHDGRRPRPRQRDAFWLNLFDAMAAEIVSRIGPASVLDAGCAMGLLVEALRARGVDAYGIDVSETAIGQVASAVQPYCTVATLTAQLPRRYDLIVTNEALEHLSAPEAERAVANLCTSTDDILFYLPPQDSIAAAQFYVRPPDYWAELFAHHGFGRDVDFDASFVTPGCVRYRRLRDPFPHLIGAYERRLWRLEQETRTRRNLAIEQRNELVAREAEIRLLRLKADKYERAAADLQTLSAQFNQLENSLGGRLLRRLQRIRAAVVPPLSIRDHILNDVLARTLGLGAAGKTPLPQELAIAPVAVRPAVAPHTAPVDIVICIHNAYQDVRRCLDSLQQHTTPPYKLILVDDGSEPATRDFLVAYAQAHGATLLRNESARGYGCAANQGLRVTAGDYVLLLNSDTVLTPDWLDRLVACAEADPHFGIVGPLSNTASWQSIPEVEIDGDWAENPLPPGVSIDEMARRVATYSGRLYPAIPFLNGFCFMLRRATLDTVGVFDEANFGTGYGEEDDFVLRARQAGWQAALADDVYVYHAQSRSFSHDRRRLLSETAGELLVAKHGQAVIDQGVATARSDKVFEGIRARSRVLHERARYIERGHARFAGRRVLFVLPVGDPGGGGHVVIDEAAAMRQMGVEVTIFNIGAHRNRFANYYTGVTLPVIYDDDVTLAAVAPDFDAVVATMNTSVDWLARIMPRDGRPVLGYYVQEFEPFMYPDGSPEYERALRSYSLIPRLVRFTKTEWTRHEVHERAGVDCTNIGASLNIDLFRPRPAVPRSQAQGPVRVAAMVRLASAYRSPRRTMELLRTMVQHYGDQVEAIVFGATLDDPAFRALPQDFRYRLAGVLGQKQMASLLNEVDVFVDVSSHQAMGLTAMESMACGAAVIVPSAGGAQTFAVHGMNSLVVDTRSWEECWQALRSLVEDDRLRRRLQAQALRDICQFYVERPAFNILNTLFSSRRQ